MAFQVTPETDVAEAAMFHGAQLEVSAQNLTTGNAELAMGSTGYDTDGFVNGDRFLVPEGVTAAKLGLNVNINGAGAETYVVFIQLLYAGGGSVNFRRDLTTSGSGDQHIEIITPMIPCTTGDQFRVVVRSSGGTGAIRAHSTTQQSHFWFEVVKAPVGRPDSPTLP